MGREETVASGPLGSGGVNLIGRAGEGFDQEL